MTMETLSIRARVRGVACGAVNGDSMWAGLKGAEDPDWQRKETGSRGAGQEAQKGGPG